MVGQGRPSVRFRFGVEVSHHFSPILIRDQLERWHSQRYHTELIGQALHDEDTDLLRDFAWTGEHTGVAMEYGIDPETEADTWTPLYFSLQEMVTTGCQ